MNRKYITRTLTVMPVVYLVFAFIGWDLSWAKDGNEGVVVIARYAYVWLVVFTVGWPGKLAWEKSDG